MRPNVWFIAFTMPVAAAFAPLQVQQLRQMQQQQKRTRTVAFLKDDIADMIDRELYRQKHRHEFETEWMEQNREAVLSSYRNQMHGPAVPSSMLEEEDLVTARQYRKDTFMAENNPQQYCADRCIATGNCDVYEDIFRLSPMEVRAFCEECVLSEGEEPCDVPAAFFEDDDVSPANPRLSKFKP